VLRSSFTERHWSPTASEHAPAKPKARPSARLKVLAGPSWVGGPSAHRRRFSASICQRVCKRRRRASTSSTRLTPAGRCFHSSGSCWALAKAPTISSTAHSAIARNASRINGNTPMVDVSALQLRIRTSRSDSNFEGQNPGGSVKGPRGVVSHQRRGGTRCA